MGKDIIDELEKRQMEYILGVRMRAVKEVWEDVLSRVGRYRDVEDNLKVKEVWVGDRRYVLCYNPEEAAKDKASREAILEALEEELERNPKALVKNRGYRRFLKIDGKAISIDKDKVAEEERFDGKFVLRTNITLSADEVALRYKDLWMVEAFFRATKSLLETRLVFHRYDDTIRGHIFSSFLALLLRHELMSSLALRGEKPEWADIVRDLAALQEVEVEQDGRRYRLRLPLQGVCGKVFQAVGV
ncbi:MAG: transposase, partial [Firmicutes bacterium]|nr:transposase [Bacillota bacterium]